MNKIYAYVIWKSFSFHFIQIKKMPQHFMKSGCISPRNIKHFSDNKLVKLNVYTFK